MLNHSIVPTSAAGYTIDNSLRLNDNDSAYLSWTPSSAGNRKTWTWSGWVKLGNLKSISPLFEARDDANNFSFLRFQDQSIRYVNYVSSALTTEIKTNAVYRDVSSWYHIVCSVDTTHSTQTDSVKLFVNGERVTSLSTANYPSLNDLNSINKNVSHKIGADQNDTIFSDGYLAEVNFIDGQALDPSNFGETGDYGEWKPIAYEGTYGTNGFYLDFENSGSLGADVSGNSNNWTPTNLAATDQMLDSPTNNFATLNSVAKHSSGDPDNVLSQGNLKITHSGSSGSANRTATLSLNDGKKYVEVYIGDVSHYMHFGTSEYSNYNSIAALNDSGSAVYGLTVTDGSPFSYTVGDIVSMAIDVPNSTIKYYKNGVYGFTGSIPVTNVMGVWFQLGHSGTSVTLNFGQDSSFAGNKIAQGNADGNGYGDFYYTPPTGYLALCTQNLPDPTVIPSEHFNTVLYTGDGVDNKGITGVGFQPDMVWTKERSTTFNHGLYDSVRGSTKGLASNTSDAEYVDATSLKSFDADGFTLGTWAGENVSGTTYVAWNWKANGSGVSNTDGTITSTVSANVDAGFSIVSYTGTGANATVGHGLSQSPEMLIVKSRSDSSNNWMVYAEPEGNTDYAHLNLTTAFGTASTVWQNTTPTSSVFSIGTANGVNQNTYNFIAYAFHSVDGFSKVGSYTGNGSTDGTFVYTGFRPAYVMVKNANYAGSHWGVHDSERDDINFVYKQLHPNLSNAESTVNVAEFDFCSNGFKLRTTSTNWNRSGDTHIYIAFAENPFKHTNAR